MTRPTTCTPRLAASCGSGNGGVKFAPSKQPWKSGRCSAELHQDASWPFLTIYPGRGIPRILKLQVEGRNTSEPRGSEQHTHLIVGFAAHVPKLGGNHLQEKQAHPYA